ncbi:MAG: hypothetical protein AAGI38_24530 [Bacteroidota bacterium]
MKFALTLLLLLISLESISQEDKTLWTAAWSPNDSLIAIGGSPGELMIFDGQTFDLLKTYSVGGVILSRLKWHPMQNKLAVITQSESFKAQILDLDQDKWIELKGLKNSLRALDWNHTGDLLAVSEFEGEISIFDTNGKQVSRFIADPKAVTGIDWHPTQNTFVAVGSRIGIYNHVGDSVKVFHPRDVEVLLLCVEWHPSGKFFTAGDYGESESGQNKLIQYWNLSGEKLAEMGKSTAEYRNIRWSPNGKWLASANDALRIWDEEGTLVHESASSADYLWGVDWNSDGSRIITTSSNGIITLWDKTANRIQVLAY